MHGLTTHTSKCQLPCQLQPSPPSRARHGPHDLRHHRGPEGSLCVPTRPPQHAHAMQASCMAAAWPQRCSPIRNAASSPAVKPAHDREAGAVRSLPKGVGKQGAHGTGASRAHCGKGQTIVREHSWRRGAARGTNLLVGGGRVHSASRWNDPGLRKPNPACETRSWQPASDQRGQKLTRMVAGITVP
jgi:hypothetical protein